MIHELEQLQNSVFSKLSLLISNLQHDSESEEYLGRSFRLNQIDIKFRKAKITPKKTGQFVTLWKRNPKSKQTEPFTSEDPFDFYIICCNCGEKSGFFFFPGYVLSEKHILTDSSKAGKRGFRVYPNWDVPENKQAEKTKDWQTNFFIDFSDRIYSEKFKTILNVNS